MASTAKKQNLTASFELPLAIREMHRFISSDENRVALHNVRLTTLDDGTLRADATCGHMLARVEIHGAALWFKGEIFIPGSVLKTLKPKKNESVTLRADNESLSFKVGDAVTTVKRDSDYFPEVDQVIPAKKDDSDKSAPVWGVDTRLVGRVYDYLRKAGMHTMVRFEAPSDDLSPMRLTAEQVDTTVTVATFVIMPCRL